MVVGEQARPRRRPDDLQARREPVRARLVATKAFLGPIRADYGLIHLWQHGRGVRPSELSVSCRSPSAGSWVIGSGGRIKSGAW